MPVTTASPVEFAEMVGLSHTYIYRLINEGVLTTHEDGRIPVQKGIRQYNEWVKTPGKQAKKKAKPVDEAAIEMNTSGGVSLALNKAKLAEKTYQARLKELDYKARTGALLDREEVEKEAAWLAEQVKGKLLAVPPRISSLCEGREARDIEAIISDAINDALKELQKVKFKGGE